MMPTERPVPPEPMKRRSRMMTRFDAETGKVKGERAAGDAAAHDDGVGRLHGVPRSRTGSPCLMAPVLSTRA